MGAGEPNRGDLPAQRPDCCRLPQLRPRFARPRQQSLHLRHQRLLPKMLMETGKFELVDRVTFSLTGLGPLSGGKGGLQILSYTG